MTVDEYVKLASAKITAKKKREQIEKEMKNHILDRVEYYTDAGYDENTAIEKALQHMGDAETVGTEIGKVHKSVLSFIIDVLAVLPLPLVAYIILFVSFGYEGTGNLGHHFISEFLFLFIPPFISVIVNRKGKHLTIMILNLITTTLYIGFRIYTKTFCSQILFILWLIISGQTSDGLPLLHKTWLKSDSIPLIIATLMMFAVIIGIQIFYISITSQKIPRPKHNKIRQHLIRAISTITFTSFIITLFAGIFYFRTSEDYRPLDLIYFIDCDEMTDIKSVDYETDGFPLYVDYDLFVLGIYHTNWGGYFFGNVTSDEAFCIPEIKYYSTNIKHMSYGRQVIEHTYHADKRYVAVIPMIASEEDFEVNVPDYAHAKWFDTTKDTVLSDELNGEHKEDAEYIITLTDNTEFTEAKKYYKINKDAYQ
ncbi:MAG: permease prefix domain 1-containing protein [Clostridia bacterium]|nr:permease prefix domain 1-containing protein [Clostridia bacterium]